MIQAPPRVLPTPVLVGREVTLRALEASDVDALVLASAESRDSYDLSPVPNGPAETAAYVTYALKQRAAGYRMPFTIVWNGRVVGTTSYYELTPWLWPAGCSLVRTDRPDAVEIGYTWLAASAQRTRVNTEAKYLLLRHAFDVWQVHSVALRTDVRNQRSRRAILGIGAKFEGVRRAHTAGSDCTVRDSAYFSIIPDEWPAARALLEQKLA